MRRILLLPLSLAFLLVPQIAVAQAWPTLDSPPAVARVGTDDVAVLVAVEDYVFVPGVPGARENLTEWETFLREGLGVSTVSTLLNEQATKEEVLAAAESAAALAGPKSTVWFLFIGHGAPAADGADGMLLGVDAQQTTRSLAARGIPRAELLRRLEAGAQKRTVVVLDACFSGRSPDGAALVPDAQPIVPVADATVADTTVVMMAAGSSELAGALPGLERPAFSYLVLGGLRGWADEGDGQVTADEAVVFARRELLTVPGRRQTPGVVGLGDTVLTLDAHEARPQTGAAVAAKPKTSPAASPSATPSSTSTSASTSDRVVTAPSKTHDIKGRSWLYLSLGLGAGAETTYESGTMLVGATLGLRAINPKSPTRFNLMAGIDYANVTNVYARESETQANAILRDAGFPGAISIEVGDRTHLVAFTTGPGLEVGRGAVGFFGELRGGFALPMGGECRAWDADEDGENQRCSNRETDVSPAFRTRFGVSYRLFELAAHAGFTPREYEVLTVDADGNVSSEPGSQTLFVAGLTFGVGFDL